MSAIDFFTFGLVSLHAFSSILPPFATANVAMSERNEGRLMLNQRLGFFHRVVISALQRLLLRLFLPLNVCLNQYRYQTLMLEFSAATIRTE